MEKDIGYNLPRKIVDKQWRPADKVVQKQVSKPVDVFIKPPYQGDAGDEHEERT